MNTQEKADDYNERAKNQIRTKAYQKGVEETESSYKAQIKEAEGVFSKGKGSGGEVPHLRNPWTI